MAEKAAQGASERWTRWRAPYAVDPHRSRGRLYDEPESLYRSPYQRDRDRIIHCNAFRRLKHKTQVFVEHEGDYFRTRLTHSIEVAQIARTIARALGLDEDLAEAVALAHDLGHTPFGHAGETELDRLTADFGGFCHNAQALKIVTTLEKRYARFTGLNLSWETLEGLVKHNGPLLGAGLPPPPGVIRSYNARHPLELESQSSAEAQAAAVADDIAYNNHDLDDGLRAGMFAFEELLEMEIVARERDAALVEFGALDPACLQLEALRRVFGAMVEDVVEESLRRIERLAPGSPEAVRAAEGPVIGFSPAFTALLQPLRDFLFARMYRHSKVNRMMSKAKRVVRDLYTLFLAEPNLLPQEWRAAVEATDDAAERGRLVADYVAGMTDRYAIDEHKKLFDPSVDG